MDKDLSFAINQMNESLERVAKSLEKISACIFEDHFMVSTWVSGGRPLKEPKRY